MNTIRMNITLPKEFQIKLAKLRNKSAFIAQALREKLAKAENERRLRSLRDSYRLAAGEETRLVKDWDNALGDGL